MADSLSKYPGWASVETEPDTSSAIQRLRAANENLTAIIRNSPVAIMTLDCERRVMTCNPAAERLFGWSEAELAGRPYPLIPAEGLAEFEDLWAEIRAGKAVTSHEVIRRRRDGSLLDISLSIASLHDPAGRVSGFLGMMVDITERKKAEAERELTLSMLRAALESTEDGILVTDLTGQPVVFNKRFVSMWRVPPEVAGTPGRSLLLYATERVADPEALLRSRDELLRHPRRELYDTLRMKDGRVFERYSRPQMISGNPVGRVYSFRDVTDRLRAEREVRALNAELERRVEERTAAVAEANAKLRRRMRELRALNGMASAIATSGSPSEQLSLLAEHLCRDLQAPGGMLLVLGPDAQEPRMERFWGIPEEAAEQLAAAPADIPGVLNCIRSRRVVRPKAGGKRRGAGATRIDLSRPTIVPVLARSQIEALMVLWNWHSRSYSDSDIRVFRSLGKQVALAMEDARLFTELRLSHERLQSLSRKVVDVQERERRHMARELHDEIGQTLTGVKLSLEMLTREAQAQPDALGRAQKLVNDLMARVRELSLRLRPAMLDDLGLVPALLWLLDTYSKQTGIRVEFEHSGETGRLPQQIETAVYRIVQEALTNVARHAQTKDAWVTLLCEDRMLVARIEDRGRGFDASSASRRFETMGLPGMMERATLLGGHVQVISAPGEGTRIVASLPLVPGGNGDELADGTTGREAGSRRGAPQRKAGASRRKRNGGQDDNNSAGG